MTGRLMIASNGPMRTVAAFALLALACFVVVAAVGGPWGVAAYFVNFVFVGVTAGIAMSFSTRWDLAFVVVVAALLGYVALVAAFTAGSPGWPAMLVVTMVAGLVMLCALVGMLAWTAARGLVEAR